ALQRSDGSAADTLDRKPLRVGVIGLGVGEQHAAAYQKNPRCRVVALCDRSDEKLHDVQKRYPGIAVTGTADDVLTNPDIDLVSIASFDDAHFEMALKAMQGGKHVFVEKPLCQTSSQLKALHEAWKHHRGHVKLASNLVLR